VLFLTPRNSQIDVVQSVGRVMRKAPGKKRGYVVLPGREMYDPNQPGRPAMDAWVVAHAQLVQHVKYGRFSASIYRIPAESVPP